MYEKERTLTKISYSTSELIHRRNSVSVGKFSTSWSLSFSSEILDEMSSSLSVDIINVLENNNQNNYLLINSRFRSFSFLNKEIIKITMITMDFDDLTLSERTLGLTILSFPFSTLWNIGKGQIFRGIFCVFFTCLSIKFELSHDVLFQIILAQFRIAC